MAKGNEPRLCPFRPCRDDKEHDRKCGCRGAKYPTKSADLLKIENEEQAVQALIVLAKTLKGAGSSRSVVILRL